MRWRYTPGLSLAFTLVLLTIPAYAFAQTANVGYANISGTSAGGRVITIELRSNSASLLGSTTYTTVASDTEETIADELADNFATAGYKAKRMKDKISGEEVVYFKRETNGKAFSLNVVEDDPNVSVTVKGSYSSAGARHGNPGRSCTVTPDHIDFGSGTAQIQLHGSGTTWLTDIDGVEVRDIVSVVMFSVMNDSLIVVDITYGTNITSDPIHVDVFGQAFDDDFILETGIVHDVTSNPLVIRPVHRAPGLSLPSLIIVAGLLVLGAVMLLRRRSDTTSP